MMRETSSAQYEATLAAAVPPLEQVRPNVWALPLAIPSELLPYILSYFVIDDSGFVHVIDAGWDSDENWQSVLAALKTMGASAERVASVTLTHMHRDHVGMTHRYQQATPARVQLSRVEDEAIRAMLLAEQGPAVSVDALAEAWGIPPSRQAELDVTFNPEGDQVAIEADVLVDEGDDLGVPGTGIQVISTPGHTFGSISLAAPGEQLLFTGDHVLPAIFGGLGLGGPTASNPVSDYVRSLEKLAPYDSFEVLPGHGYRFTGLAARRAESAEHHLKRSREAAAVLAANPAASTWEVASQLKWSAGWENLHGAYVRSALAQTAWHMERAGS
ncbi:MBL fold metallo-hydrolase [Subtercola lobariae]|uniref:MBL fold metallo-hydrolase n=1 Tax=Subtercola lobariae TaxID=1588641 RepID=A0A917B8W8_9MICO|nr:MBL fold metallo-hydrolase [Subtercola lobariae]GGF30984.1 MBL fold metallo-hydrolase [Subtercola lobariae]